jgi:hypothetical protein
MPKNDNFENYLEALVLHKTQERENLTAQWQGVQRALGVATVELGKIQAALDLYRGFVAREGSQTEAGSASGESVGVDAAPEATLPAQGPPLAGSLASVAYAIMTMHGGKMRTTELVPELRAAGKLKGGGATGRSDYGTVFRALARDTHRFRKTAPGEFEIIRTIETSEPQPPSSQSPTAVQG